MSVIRFECPTRALDEVMMKCGWAWMVRHPRFIMIAHRKEADGSNISENRLIRLGGLKTANGAKYGVLLTVYGRHKSLPSKCFVHPKLKPH